MRNLAPYILILSILFCLLAGCKGNNSSNIGPSYKVDTIPIPQGLLAETGGLAFFPDGRLIACFTRGEVMIFDPETEKWDLFAEGLHEPLGIQVVNQSEIIVLQRPELTRIRDTDGDGKADLYEKITDDFGISGNYHEFNYGPVMDDHGNAFIALNTASSGGGIRENVRGELKLEGRDGEDGRRQMFSVVPFRGWVLKVNQEGEVIPYASGFRSPNGLGFDGNGNLFVTDNQSDWVETSTFYHVRKGHFYGHPASLVWENDWKGDDPFSMPIDSLNQLRTRAAVLFPHGIMANSPTQPVYIENNDHFRAFEGQFLVGEMNRERIVRVMLEKIAGEFQGACVPFMDEQGLRAGNNRLAFAPDGRLWVGQIAHGWRGDQGIQRISYTGNPPMDISAMNLTREGFKLTFTQPLEKTIALQKDNYQMRQYFYEYKKKPFDEPVDKSTQSDLKTVPIENIGISSDHKTINLTLGELKPGYVYELKLNNILSKEGRPLDNNLICYTLNNLRPE
ncbi:MAG: hypothetical protein WD431_21750 [Cyclobacteriaceae bacterium]